MRSATARSTADAACWTSSFVTDIDRRLVASIDTDGLVCARHRDPAEQALRTARLRTLERMALAQEEGRGRWGLDPGLEPVLRRMGLRGDIIRTMSQAIRRATGGVTREPDGSWIIAPDHLARAEAYERQQSANMPVIVETLSSRPVAQLPGHDGPTWLDSALIAGEPADLQRGFGADVRRALDQRRQWLLSRQLADSEGEAIRYPADLIATLRQRELRQVAGQLSQELGLKFAETRPGERIEGIYRRAVQVGDQRYAVIAKSREFTLVPWRPVLEREVGKCVSASCAARASAGRSGASAGWGSAEHPGRHCARMRHDRTGAAVAGWR